jgi:hypothetical protein
MSIADTTNLFLSVAPRVAASYGYDATKVDALIAFIVAMMPRTFRQWWNKLNTTRRDWVKNKLIELLPPA